MNRKWHLAAVLCGVLAFGGGVFASPQGMGTVGGRALDLKGKPVAKARVTLQASDGGHLQTSETNAEGRFWFAFLPEGQYSVRASDQTRTSEWRQGIWVSPGRQTNVTLHLHRRQESKVR